MALSFFYVQRNRVFQSIPRCPNPELSLSVYLLRTLALTDESLAVAIVIAKEASGAAGQNYNNNNDPEAAVNSIIVAHIVLPFLRTKLFLGSSVRRASTKYDKTSKNSSNILSSGLYYVFSIYTVTAKQSKKRHRQLSLWRFYCRRKS